MFEINTLTMDNALVLLNQFEVLTLFPNLEFFPGYTTVKARFLLLLIQLRKVSV